MHTEIPVLKRCCCCIPLRYGLLMWGYLILIISLLISTYVTVTLVKSLVMGSHYHYSLHFYDFLALMYFLELYIEVIFSIVLIVAAHKKNEKLLKIYYYYAIVFTIMFTMTSVALWSMSVAHTVRYYEHFSPEYRSTIALYTLQDAAPAFVFILINCYVIFLVRSEILKLSSNHTFKFVNNAAEAECKMNNSKIYCNDEPEVSELNAPQ